MATCGDKFKYHGIVFHSEEEVHEAEKFCKELKKILLGNGRRLNIVTKEYYSLPGRQEVDIVSSAVCDAEFIFISDNYYCTDLFGQFCGNVAFYNKLPSKFIVLKVGFTGKPQPHIASLYCLPLKDWCLSEEMRVKITRLFFQDDSSPSELHKENKQHEMLRVMNPSITSTTSLQYEISQEEIDLKRPFTTTINDTANTDVSSLTDEDLVTDASLQPEEEEEDPRSTQRPVPSQVARVAPQPHPMASSSAGGSNDDNPIAHFEGNPRVSADHVQRTDFNVTDEMRDELRDYL